MSAIVDLLQGKPFKHPVHPMLTHLPVSLFPLSLIFDLASFGLEQNWLVRAAFYAMLLGILSALVAAVPGFVDYLYIRRDKRAFRIATWHMVMNLAAVVLYVVNAGWRWPHIDATTVPGWPFVMSLIGVAILMASGYLGGMLIYDDGIGVGRHRRRTKTPDITLRPAASPDADGFVPVADADALGDRETLRVEVGGYTMAILRLDGKYFAFQEFCTHRFGPLSEGCIEFGQIECPWHRSRFDVSTGKVTEGPAKVDLKTFEVQIRNGKIAVKLPA
jgi:uncharacterized membrane protein/nitrite reductase/ring-hydroxylating ferredoxin subunit